MDERFTGQLRRSDSAPGMAEALLPPIYEPDSHAANLLELDNGDLLCVWFNGPGEGDAATNVVLSRLPAGSVGWTEPALIAGDPDRSEQNPVLGRDSTGSLWLWHTSSEPHDQKTARVVVRTSDDLGRSWSSPRVQFSEPGIFLRNPPVRLRDGSWILPAYYCRSDADFSVLKVSSDDGLTWHERTLPDSDYRIQLTLVERDDGTLLAMFRSRDADRVWASESTDAGRTWTSPRRTELPNNNSAIQLLRLRDGTLALVFNDASLERDQFRWVSRRGVFRKKAVRTPLTLAVSEDGGATWPLRRNIQLADDEYGGNEMGYSYPSIIQSGDGCLHIAYSYLRKTIKHVRIDDGWVKGDHA